MWVQFSTSLERTTNACGSFHSKFYEPHPDIYKCIEIAMQACNAMQCKLHMQANTNAKINTSVKTKERTNVKTKYIQQQIELYNSGELSRLDFVKSVSYRSQKLIVLIFEKTFWGVI